MSASFACAHAHKPNFFVANGIENHQFTPPPVAKKPPPVTQGNRNTGKAVGDLWSLTRLFLETSLRPCGAQSMPENIGREPIHTSAMFQVCIIVGFSCEILEPTFRRRTRLRTRVVEQLLVAQGESPDDLHRGQQKAVVLPVFDPPGSIGRGPGGERIREHNSIFRLLSRVARTSLRCAEPGELTLSFVRPRLVGQ